MILTNNNMRGRPKSGKSGYCVRMTEVEKASVDAFLLDLRGGKLPSGVSVPKCGDMALKPKESPATQEQYDQSCKEAGAKLHKNAIDQNPLIGEVSELKGQIKALLDDVERLTDEVTARDMTIEKLEGAAPDEKYAWLLGKYRALMASVKKNEYEQ